MIASLGYQKVDWLSKTKQMNTFEAVEISIRGGIRMHRLKIQEIDGNEKEQAHHNGDSNQQYYCFPFW